MQDTFRGKPSYHIIISDVLCQAFWCSTQILLKHWIQLNPKRLYTLCRKGGDDDGGGGGHSNDSSSSSSNFGGVMLMTGIEVMLVVW